MFALFLIISGMALRLLPHPSNFTPITAIALFSGGLFPAALALTVPLLLMIGSDILIGPHDLFILTWGCFFLVSLIGLRIKNNLNPGKIFYGTLAGASIFFIVTNLGVFLFQSMYSKTWAGLGQCFWLALPFFRNSLAGDLFYSFVLFGLFAVATKPAQKNAFGK